jgi:Mob1/phocein family
MSESDGWFHQEDRLNQILASIDPSVLAIEEALAIAVPPPGTDPNLWIYEWLRYVLGKPWIDIRRLTRDLTLLIVAMINDGCNSSNCPEMRTQDCQYLCATHDKARECPATDYIIHTLDFTTALLTSSKLFPSR